MMMSASRSERRITASQSGAEGDNSMDSREMQLVLRCYCGKLHPLH